MKWIITACTCLLMGCAMPVQHLDPDLHSGYIQPLAVGERIWICNADHIELTPDNQHTIRADSTVQLPVVGTVIIAGMTPLNAAQKIQDIYIAKGIYQEVQVEVIRESIQDASNNRLQAIDAKASQPDP